MDSLTQFALGAGVGLAVLSRRIGPRRAALTGGVLGTLPDLDVLFPFDDPVDSFILHRGATHSFFVHAVVTPIFGEVLMRLFKSLREERLRSYLAVYLIFVTHAIIDALTIYGTRVFWPLFPDPVGCGISLHHRPALHPTASLRDDLGLLPKFLVAGIRQGGDAGPGPLHRLHGLGLGSAAMGEEPRRGDPGRCGDRAGASDGQPDALQHAALESHRHRRRPLCEPLRPPLRSPANRSPPTCIRAAPSAWAASAIWRRCRSSPPSATASTAWTKWTRRSWSRT